MEGPLLDGHLSLTVELLSFLSADLVLDSFSDAFVAATREPISKF